MQDIWSAYVGPGVQARGVNTTTWADQTDTRPTLLALAGLKDDYNVDGRVLTELLAPHALSRAVRENAGGVVALGRVYKQILASTGRFAADTLTASTRALASGSASNDTEYQRTEAALTALDRARDHLADRIGPALLDAQFDNRPISHHKARRLIHRADALLAAAHALAR
jgi:hypothetical protein